VVPWFDCGAEEGEWDARAALLLGVQAFGSGCCLCWLEVLVVSLGWLDGALDVKWFG
jgi:hypothetical protein